MKKVTKKAKKDFFDKLIDLEEKKVKAEKSFTTAKTRRDKAEENFNNFIKTNSDHDNNPVIIPEGKYKYNGYLIEVYSWGDLDIEVEPKYEKIK